MSDPPDLIPDPPPRVTTDATSQPPPPSGPPLSVPVGGRPEPPAQAGGLLPPASWGAAKAFGGLGFVILLAIGLALVVSAFDPDIESLGAQVSLQAALAASLIVTAFWFARPQASGLAPREVLGLRRPLRKPIWLSVATYFGYIACAIGISLLFAPEQEDITRELGGDSGALGAVIAGFLIVVVAPVSEEIFFRGFLFRGMRRSMHGIAAALLASAIWGIFHYTGPGTWGVVLQITVFGLWLSWLYERTGSIYPTIAVHAVNNAIAFTILMSS